MAASILVFTWQEFYQSSNPEAYSRLLFDLWLSRGDFDLHALITYQFLHADWMHLLGNMLFLYVFGPNVEDRLGRFWFLLFYLVGGVVSGLAHVATDQSPVIGASGAISAVTGAYLALFPRTHLRVLLWFFIIGVYSIPAWWLIALAIAKDLVFSGIGEDNVARVAHLGGYAFGLAVCLSLLWWKVLPREAYDLFSIGRQAKRRREFHAMTSKGQAAWTSDTQRVAKKKIDEKRSALEEAAMDERAQISVLLSEARFDEATTRYEKALDHFPDFTLSRDDLIALGNHLFTNEKYTLASSAYENLVARFPHDTETPRTVLLLALINARYLNDPVRAKQLLADAKGKRLDSSYASLLESLEAELG